MKRRILSILTALALCLSLCPAWALAAEASWSCGETGHEAAVTAVLRDGVLTVSGTGRMADCPSGGGPWCTEDIRENINSIVIEGGVTYIGEKAFFGCSSVRSVTISEGVEGIGENAFGGCLALTTVTVPCRAADQYAYEWPDSAGVFNKHTFGENGLCGSCGTQAEARVETGGSASCYTTLEEALTAADGAENAAVTLLQDVTADNLSASKGTFDLNGKTITGFMYIRGAMTVTDSQGGGKIEKLDEDYALIVKVPGLKITGGSFKGIICDPGIPLSGLLGGGYAYYDSSSQLIDLQPGQMELDSFVTVKAFDLDLSSAAADRTGPGYRWEDVQTDPVSGGITSGTLTLAPGFSAGKVTLPDAAVTVVTTGDCRIGTLTPPEIYGSASAEHMQLAFSGTGTLTIAGHVEISGGNGNSLTVNAGAKVVADNGISIGASGVDGAVTVNGNLTVAQGSGVSAIYGGRVSVGNTGVLEISGQQGLCLCGMDSGLNFSGLFTVTGDGRFTADCADYNVRVQPSGSFPPGITAEDAIHLSAEYMPEDCGIRLENGTAKQIDFIRKSTGAVYSGPLTIHKNHIWSSGWTDSGGDTHYHVCTFAGCSAKQPGSELPHYYAHGASACRDCGHGRPDGAPDSDGGGSSGGSGSEDSGSSGGGSSSGSESSSGGSGGSGGGSTRYTVTVEKGSHGEVRSDRRTASRGETVTLTVVPDGGYELDSLTVTDSRGDKMELAEKDGGYTFLMPGRNVTVRAVFIPRACTGGADCPSRGFSDLDSGEWYHEAVDYVLQNGLMNGYGGGLFGPDGTLTRAQFAQILYNREGRPAVTGGSVFTDVDRNAWYGPAVVWAASQGIVEGYGDGRFGPGDPLTRQQLAAMLWRYAGSPAPAGQELDFTDADEAGGYALEALCWAVERGILQGKGDGILDPRGRATRAGTAAMFMRYLSE